LYRNGVRSMLRILVQVAVAVAKLGDGFSYFVPPAAK
jgi:hypothetical protein